MKIHNKIIFVFSLFSLIFLIFRTSFFLLTFCTFLVGSTSFFILSHADHMLCFAHPLGAVGLPPPLPVVCSYVAGVSLLLPPPSCTKIWWSQARCFCYSPSAAAHACAQVGPCCCAVAILSWHGGSVFFWHLSEGLMLFVKHLSGKQDIYYDCRKGICWFTVVLFS